MILPTLRQLQFLVALGDTGSFSRAAEACHVTQPTLSAGIKELEDLLGVKLAEREARTILEADPTNEYVTLLLARVLERQSRHDEAAAVRKVLVALTGDERHGPTHQALA